MDLGVFSRVSRAGALLVAVLVLTTACTRSDTKGDGPGPLVQAESNPSCAAAGITAGDGIPDSHTNPLVGYWRSEFGENAPTEWGSFHIHFVAITPALTVSMYTTGLYENDVEVDCLAKSELGVVTMVSATEGRVYPTPEMINRARAKGVPEETIRKAKDEGLFSLKMDDKSNLKFGTASDQASLYVREKSAVASKKIEEGIAFVTKRKQLARAFLVKYMNKKLVLQKQVDSALDVDGKTTNEYVTLAKDVADSQNYKKDGKDYDIPNPKRLQITSGDVAIANDGVKLRFQAKRMNADSQLGVDVEFVIDGADSSKSYVSVAYGFVREDAGQLVLEQKYARKDPDGKPLGWSVSSKFFAIEN